MESDSMIQEIFATMSVEIVLFPETTKLSFSAFQYFKDYVDKEVMFWTDCTRGKAAEIRGHFMTIQTELKNVTLNNLTDQEDFSTEIRRKLESILQKSNKNAIPCIYSNTMIGRFIKESYLKSPEQANAAYVFLFQNDRVDLSNVTKEYFKGLLHSFIIGDTNIMTENELKTQRDSLSDLRESYSQDINNLHTDYLSQKEKTDNTYNVFKESMDTWKSTTKDDFNTFHMNSIKTIGDLETLYEEKLRLDSPAKYWRNLANEYEGKGKKWKNCSLVLCAGFIIYLTLLFYNLPEAWKIGKWLDLSSIKSTVVFALIIGIGAFLLSLFTKLSISAYHLSRDAKERFQLTYVYLSLLNKKAVTEDERSIVMQAIFSRADTGLLKGESGPTLPDGLLSHLFKHIQR